MRAGLLPLLLISLLALWAPHAGAADRTVSSAPTDQGYLDGRAWLDVDADRKADYCRIVGNPGALAIACTLASGEGFGADRSFPVGGVSGGAYVDADGDGAPDFCRLVGTAGSDERLACSTAKRETRTASADWGDAAGRAWTDFDADGKADFCRVVGTDAKRIACTRLDGTTVASGAIDAGPEAGRAWADVNGDRYSDFCRQVGATASCLLGGATGWAASASSAPTDMGYPAGRAWVDFDGDGRTDYCRLVGNGGGTDEQVACTTSKDGPPLGASVGSNGHVGWGTSRGWADFDGDGRLDFCRLIAADGSSARAGCIALVPGGGNKPFGASEPLLAGQDPGRAWVDHNADGKADYCRLVGTGSPPSANLFCTLSNGSDFSAPPPPPATPAPAPAQTQTVAAAEPEAPRKVTATVRTFWRVGRRTTRLLSLRVAHLPAGGSVRVACRARRGCPFAVRVFTNARARGGQLARSFRRGLRPGSKIEVRVAAPGAVDKVVLYTIRGRKLPKRVVS